MGDGRVGMNGILGAIKRASNSKPGADPGIDRMLDSVFKNFPNPEDIIILDDEAFKKAIEKVFAEMDSGLAGPD